MIAIL